LHKVAPADFSGTISGQGHRSPAPVTTDIYESRAPEPTRAQAERGGGRRQAAGGRRQAAGGRRQVT